MSEGRVERRLAAILAVDVAGYSRLMGEDEEGTLAALRAVRRELGDPKIAEHRAVCHISYSPALRLGIINGRELRVAPQFEFPLWVETRPSSTPRERQGCAESGHPRARDRTTRPKNC